LICGEQLESISNGKEGMENDFHNVQVVKKNAK